nr:hypothetical protein CFP56_69888 [Quercus suber]
MLWSLGDCLFRLYDVAVDLGDGDIEISLRCPCGDTTDLQTLSFRSTTAPDCNEVCSWASATTEWDRRTMISLYTAPSEAKQCLAFS